MQPSSSGIEGSTAANSIADDLATKILVNLAPGSSLPSEAELAGRYDVSRLTIREALKLLAGRGLLDIGRGRRAIVREPSGAAFGDFVTSTIHTDPRGLFDLNEVRLSLEVQSATLAAKRASRPALAAIEAALNGMREAEAEMRREEDSAGAEERFHRADIGFHEALALASGNRLLIFLFEAIAGPLEESFRISRRGHEARGRTLADTVDAHQRILDAVTQGSGQKAAAAMRQHLENTERDIRSAMSRLAEGPSAPEP